MKIQMIASAVVFLLFFVNVDALLAAPNSADRDVRAQASQALARDREVAVRLTNKAVYRGKVQAVEADSFTLQTSGAQITREIKFSEVATFQEQGAFASGMKKFGKGLGFLFTTKIGFTLLSTSLVVARLIIYNNRTRRPKDIGLTRVD
jgi:hypothetical protein